jgi:hypothetical protein
VTPPGVLLGEKKKLCSVSPRPKVLSNPGAGASRLTTGRMVRMMRFQSALSLVGITGWKLRRCRSASSEP